jgi:hypothetical protein
MIQTWLTSPHAQRFRWHTAQQVGEKLAQFGRTGQAPDASKRMYARSCPL